MGREPPPAWGYARPVKLFTGRGANQPFDCRVCGASVPPLEGGGYRNHCPYCLHSLHVDVNPGDRASECGGVLEPVGVEPGKKGWVIVHRCRSCGAMRRNRAALDDPGVSDDYDVILAISAGRPPRW